MLRAVNDEEYLAQNLKRDYLTWAGSQHDREGEGPLEQFSFIDHPFVYEPATKAAILGFANNAARVQV
jgi:hypothetical protein